MSENTAGPLDWKEKYLSSVDEIENREKYFQSQLDLFRRALVRVSLAADGVDDKLDQYLAQLRDGLRGAFPSEQLEALLQNIEAVIRKLDDRKQHNASDLELGFERLVNSLMIDQLSRKTKRRIKEFNATLPQSLGQRDAHAQLIEEYANILNEVLEHLLNKDQADTNGGLWQRLFSKPKQRSETTDLHAMRTSIDADGLDLDIGPSGDGSHVEEHIAKERVIGIILTLLDQLNAPEPLIARAQKIRSLLKKGVSWNELPETLSETISLVTGSRMASQREFETFLMALNSRLVEIQQFIVSNKSEEIESLQSADTLDKTIKGQVGSLQVALGQVTDVADLKALVQSRLDSIVQSVDGYRQEKEKKKDVVIEKLEALSCRLEAMEGESHRLKQTIADQREQALRDALTQLPNRQAYMEHADKELARRARYGSQLSLVVSDVDHFKKVNDTYGHLSGDKVLKSIAKEMVKRLRQSDFIARFGGEEFVILMPETDQAAAMKAIDNVREAVSNCPFHFKEERVPITVSFGVTQVHDGDTIETAFARADKALYEAKEQGRNRVIAG